MEIDQAKIDRSVIHWVPNEGAMPVDPECEVILRFGNGTETTTTAGHWHWGMHRIMPGTIIAWAHA